MHDGKTSTCLTSRVNWSILIMSGQSKVKIDRPALFVIYFIMNGALSDDLAYQTSREMQCIINMGLVLRAHKLPYDIDSIVYALSYEPQENQ